MEYVGQVINGTPTPASSNQFGNLQAVSGVDPSLRFTFYTEAETVKTVANGPLRIVDRTGTTTIYLTSAPGDFSNPDSFRSGTPVQVSTLRQQVIVDTLTGAFSVVNINSITSVTACHTATVLALNTAMRSSEIRQLRWSQIDLENRSLIVGHSKTDAGEGRPIPLNADAFEALVLWAGRYRGTEPDHYVFPWCESRQIDPSRATKGWRTAWRHALKQAGFHCRFHDLRHTAITKLSEGQANDMTIMATAGHVSKKMLEHYSHVRMAAKRAALEAIVQTPERTVFEEGVHQNVHQLREGVLDASSKRLN